MPSREEVQYFGAGPAPLPTPVLEEASKVLLNYNNSGIGVAEISHRSAEATEIIQNAQKALRHLLDIPESDGPEGYQIVFLHGGGSGEFSASIYHMVSVWVAKQWKHLKEYKYLGLEEDAVIDGLRDIVEEKMKLDYLVTGSWSSKAAQEAARLVGGEKVNIVSDSRSRNDGKFGTIASEDTWTPTKDEADCVMTYYCDNETVDGVEFQSTPPGHNLVGDMSSNFLSRPVDVRKHAAIFGGAQKNIGTTGITIAIISNKFLPPHTEMADPKLLRKLGLPIGPIVLDWPTIVKNKSLYNTIPILDVWIAGKVMDRLLERHPGSSGIPMSGQEQEVLRKSNKIYSALDANSSVYRVVPDKSIRSRMNICFRVKGGDADAEKAFLKGAEAKGLIGIKGHRSVGGMRISNYNAVPETAADSVAQYLLDYAKENSPNGSV